MKEVIKSLGDRRHSGFCLDCGTILLSPYNDYHCCPGCTEKIQYNLEKFKQKRKKKKKVGHIVVQSGDILRQVGPVGVPVK